MRQGVIVLCGGKSSRIGYPKAMLPFGPETMLTRVLRQVDAALTARIVVAAVDQPLPDLPPDVIVTRDTHPNRGPLEGIYAGFTAGRDLSDAFYVTSCDVPLLKAAWVQAVFDQLQTEFDIVVPVDDKHHHPLAAVYRPTVLPIVQELLAAEQRRPFFLFERARTLRVPVEKLRSVDSDLVSLINVNRREDYLLTLGKAGFKPTQEILSRLLE